MIRPFRPVLVSSLIALVALGATLSPAQTAPQRPAAAPAVKPSGQGTRLSTAPDPRVALAKRMPGSKPEDFRPTPVPGLYEYARGATSRCSISI